MSDFIADFRDAMRANGVPYVGEIVPDGKLRRVYVEGDRRGSRNGWYLLFGDGKPAGAFGSMRNGGGKTTWSAKGTKPLTREEREKLRAEMAEKKARRERAEREQRAAAAAKANGVWSAASDASDHPYLKRKGVQSYGLKVATWVRDYGSDPVTGEVREARIANALLIPMRNSRREIVSLQAIFPNDKNALKRDKDFLAAGEKLGCFFSIGKPTQVDGRPVIVLAEGYATGASIHAATGLGVIVVFDAGNLLPVARTVRRLMAAATILLCADNDAFTVVKGEPTNVGVLKATEAAAAVDGKVVFPRFRDVSSKPSDFNDLQALEGTDEVRRQVMASLSPNDDTSQKSPNDDTPEPPPHDDVPAGPEPEPAAPAPAPAQTKANAPAPAAAADEEDAEDSGPTDSDGYFTVLGHDRERIYIYQHEKRMITHRGEASWDKSALFALAPLQWWEMHFRGEKGLNKDMAVNWLIRLAFKRGFYDPSLSRGRGAWLDENRIVYHFGHMLTVDGTQMGVAEVKSRYVYEQGRHLPLPADTELTDAEGRAIFDITKQFRWTLPSSAVLLAGWVFLAPICGALQWRPHIWLTGGAGSGKSTILSFIHLLMNGSALYAQGNSTEAGVRQTLRNDALPVLFDETEQNNEREMNRIQAVLSLIRQSSTESEAKTLKGTQHGSAMDFMIRSIFCLSSIQVGIKHQADYERIAILALRPKREAEDAAADWQSLKTKLADLRRDRTLPARMLRRSLNMLPVILQNIDTFATAAAGRFGSQREGDQYGALLAGAWSLVTKRPATLADAEQMIDRYNWSEYLEHSETEESAKALSALMGAPIRMPRGESVTVYELACRALGMDVETVDTAPAQAGAILRRHGMAVTFNGLGAVNADLLVSNNSVELAKLLEGTPFAADLKGQLLRVEGARRHEKPVSFNGVKDRCIAIPMSAVLDDDRPLPKPAYEPGVDDEVPF